MNLKKILKRCKCGVHLSINAHRDFRQTVEEYFEDLGYLIEDPIEVTPEIKKKMIELNTIIELQVYPNTPVSFFTVYHYDLDLAIEEMERLLFEEDK